MASFEQDDFARGYIGRFQLLSVACGAAYGVLALAGLIATHLVLGGPLASLGALLACVSALCAYLNFSVVSVAADNPWVGRTNVLSILFGVASGVLVIAEAI